MAYLNVRERRIEAKIAYVGPELAGKATNFDHLRRNVRKVEAKTSDATDVLSLSWQPTDTGRFRDCSVFVEVVSPREGIAEKRLDEILREADGVVVVVDAHPSAQARNRASFNALRVALESRSVPVVVQVNKTDLPDALSVDDVVGALDDARGFTHVAASATQGKGVLETLEAALEGVLAQMAAEHPEGRAVAPTAPKTGATDGGHPLIAALRQVLRETVREHVEDLGSRLAARVEVSLSRVEERLATTEGLVVKMRAELEAATTKTNEEPMKYLLRLEHAVRALRSESNTALVELTEYTFSASTKLDELSARLERPSTK